MSSQDVQRKNQQYYNKLRQLKANIQRFIHKDKDPFQPRQTAESPLSGSSLLPSILQQPPNSSSGTAAALNADSASIVNNIDEIINRIKNKGQPYPVQANKNEFSLFKGVPVAPSENTQYLTALKSFALTSTQQKKYYTKRLEVYQASQENKSEFQNQANVQQQLDADEQEMDLENSQFNQHSQLQNSSLDRLVSRLPPLPNPIERQKQVMQHTLMKYREALTEMQDNKVLQGDDSMDFDLSKSIILDEMQSEATKQIQDGEGSESLPEPKQSQDPVLARLYQQRDNILQQIEKIDSELLQLE